MESPLVSILMTSYNRERFIGSAIESVQKSSYDHFELIIVDDVSSDDTVSIARGYAAADSRIKIFVNEKNLGDYPNRNRAAELAQGKYIKYCDADDELFDFGIKVMVSAMESNPEAAYGLSAYPMSDPPAKWVLSPAETYRDYFDGAGYFDRAPGSSIIRTNVFRQLGGFSGKRMIGDYEFWFRIAQNHPMVKLPFDTYHNRLHPGQESATEYAKKNYGRLKRRVVINALLDPACPVSVPLRTRWLARIMKEGIREKIGAYLKIHT